MKAKKIQQKNNINIFLNEYFNVIVLLLSVFIFVVSFFVILSPKINATTMLIADNIATQKKLYAEQEKKLAELKTIKQVYDDILPSDLHKFNRVLPSDYVKESLYGELEEIIIRNGFVLGSVLIEEEPEEDANPAQDLPTIGGTAALSQNIGKVTFIVSINTIDYRGFKKLLNSLESSARLFDIDMVDFSESEDVVELRIITYYYKDSALNKTKNID